MSTNPRTTPTRRERRAAERAAHRAPVVVAPARLGWRSPVALVSIGALAVGIALVAVLAIGAMGPGLGAIRAAPAVPAAELRDGRSLGSAGAPVHVEVYEDPQCPACGRWTREVEQLLVAKYVRNGTVRLTYRDFAFLGRESTDAAVAMRAADRLGDRFWDLHAVVFENQHGENKGAFSRDRLVEMATVVGLDRAAFRALLDDPDLRAAVEQESTQGASLGVRSTPTLVVNGAIAAGVPSWESLSAAIEQAAALAASPAPGSPGASAGAPSPRP